MKNTLTIMKRNSLKCPNLPSIVQTVKPCFALIVFFFKAVETLARSQEGCDTAEPQRAEPGGNKTEMQFTMLL